jgi:ATP-dependent Clp protease ATP-binding subunit ClpA
MTMMSRLTPAAKAVVVRGYEYAARDQAGQIREEHLLEALLADSEGSRLLGDRLVDEGVLRQFLGELEDSRRKGGLTAAEEAALGSLGIDVDAVVRQIEDQLGTQALAAEEPKPPRWWHKPALSGDAVHVLTEAERHLSATGGRSLGVEHLVLGMVSAPTALAESLARRGVCEASVRDQLVARSELGGPR